MTEEEPTFDAPMYKGKKRRCNYCPKTYIWKENLSPIEIEDMARNNELMNRKLVCSWMCYFKYIGRFVRKLSCRNIKHSWIRGIYYSQHICITPRYPYSISDDTALDYNYSFVKEDQEHYQ